MRARAVLVAVFLVVVAGAAIAEDTQRLVLVGGKTFEVTKATLQEGLVYVTFADGRMQAYPMEEVDLEASGLITPVEGAAESSKPQPLGLASAVSSATTESRITLTDADVAHVVGGAPAAEGEEGEAEEGAAGGPRTAALLVSNLRQEISGGIMDLTGRVTNNGSNPVSNITLSAQATSSDGQVTGRGTTVVSQELAPNASVNFTMSFPVQGQVSDVSVRASAAVAEFEFRPVEAQPAAAVEEPEEEEYPEVEYPEEEPEEE